MMMQPGGYDDDAATGGDDAATGGDDAAAGHDDAAAGHDDAAARHDDDTVFGALITDGWRLDHWLTMSVRQLYLLGGEWLSSDEMELTVALEGRQIRRTFSRCE
jgi:hypothetical protein